MSSYVLDECLEVLKILVDHNVEPDHFCVCIAGPQRSECYPSLFSINILSIQVYEDELNEILNVDLEEEELDHLIELRDRVLEVAKENGLIDPFGFMDKIFSLDLKVLLSIYFEIHFFDDFESLKKKYFPDN